MVHAPCASSLVADSGGDAEIALLLARERLQVHGHARAWLAVACGLWILSVGKDRHEVGMTVGMILILYDAGSQITGAQEQNLPQLLPALKRRSCYETQHRTCCSSPAALAGMRRGCSAALPERAKAGARESVACLISNQGLWGAAAEKSQQRDEADLLLAPKHDGYAPIE
jgi:hypothetical protein